MIKYFNQFMLISILFLVSFTSQNSIASGGGWPPECSLPDTGSTDTYGGGGGGGGGCGSVIGNGGTGGSNTGNKPTCYIASVPGDPGTENSPGVGGTAGGGGGFNEVTGDSGYAGGDGGIGGDCGSPGTSGSDYPAGFDLAGQGGAAGAAIVTNGNSITWTAGSAAPQVKGPIQ